MKPTYVYFVESGLGGPVKVGIALDVAARLDSLQGGNPVPLRLLAAIRGSRETELRIHRRFAQGNIHREWFRRDTPGLNALLAEIALPDGLVPKLGPADIPWEEACVTCIWHVEPDLVYLVIHQCFSCLLEKYSPRNWSKYAFLQEQLRVIGGGGNRTRAGFPTHWRVRPDVALAHLDWCGSRKGTA